MSVTNEQIRQYLETNPLATNREISDLFNITYDRVRSFRRRLQEKATIQKVETPEGRTGVLTKGKMWQLHDGSWRESLQFEVDKVEELEKFSEKFLKELRNIGVAKRPALKDKPKGQVCLEISLPDVHIGKGDTDNLVQIYVQCVFDLLEKAEKFNIERIVLPIGNDGLNSEGKRKTTTAGTFQDDTIHWQDSFRIYWITLINMINTLSSMYPVDVIVVPGNHDEERVFYIGEVLKAYYEDSQTVTINNNGEYRKYYEYGVNMLLYTHGNNEKKNTLPLLMATEQPEMFARTKFREVHCGHFHKEMLDEFCGVKVRFIPSICTTDEWHKMMGYNHLRVAQAYLWNKETGLEGSFQVNIT